MLTATGTANLRFANMADRGATGFGVTLDDPSGSARTVGVFGHSGAAKSVRGWRTTRASLRSDVQLLDELRKAGISVLEIPNDVAITPYSASHQDAREITA